MPLKPEKIKYLIIHHTATARDKTTFSAVKRYHVSKGWGDIGYHYFITADGKVWPGRSEDTIGAHARSSNMNYKSLGICLTGNFMKEVPTYEQLQSLHDLLLKLMKKYKISRENVLGHREVPKSATACPGDFLLEWIEKFRKEKSEVKKSPQITKVIDHLEQVINILKSL